MAKTPNLNLNITDDETTLFEHWRRTIDGDFQTIPFPYTPIDNIKAYAKWAQSPTATITFDVDGGLAVESITVPVGTVITELPVTTRASKVFVAWRLPESETTVGWLNQIQLPYVVTKDITLKAFWDTDNYTVYTATFDSQGGVPAFNYLKFPTSYMFPSDALPAAKKVGYTFEGWYTEPVGGSKLVSSTNVNSNRIYYAHWEQQEVTTYTIDFDSAGGTPVSSVTINAGQTIQAPEVPTRNGDTFLGWYTVTSEKSNTQLIDDFAGDVYDELDEVVQELGEVTNDLSDLSNQFSARASLKVTDITVSNWIADTSVEGMSYKANITITGVTANDLATVVLAQAESISGNYASINDTSENTVTIYSKVNTTITIPTIWVQRS